MTSSNHIPNMPKTPFVHDEPMDQPIVGRISQPIILRLKSKRCKNGSIFEYTPKGEKKKRRAINLSLAVTHKRRTEYWQLVLFSPREDPNVWVDFLEGWTFDPVAPVGQQWDQVTPLKKGDMVRVQGTYRCRWVEMRDIESYWRNEIALYDVSQIERIDLMNKPTRPDKVKAKPAKPKV